MNSSPIRIAIIGALSIIIFGLIAHFTGNSYSKFISYITYLIVVITILLSIYFYKKNDMHDIMTFKEGFWAGMRATLVFSLIGCIWMIVFIKIINPEFMSVMKSMQLDEMTKNGMSDDQIEKAMPMIEKFMSLPILFITAFIMYTVIGTITSAIASAVMKNRSENDLPTQ